MIGKRFLCPLVVWCGPFDDHIPKFALQPVVLPLPEQRSTRIHRLASPNHEDLAVLTFPRRKPIIADINEKALFERGPYSIRKQG